MLGSHVEYEASWFVAILVFALVTMLVMQFLREPAVVEGPNRAARSALVLIALVAAIFLFSHGDPTSGSTQRAVEFGLWVVAILSGLAAIVLSWVGAARVRRQGDRLVAAVAFTSTVLPAVYLVGGIVVCILTGCVFWGT
jgi:hypothetical protein